MSALTPSRTDLTDAGFLTGGFLLALVGFASTFTGSGFLVVGAAGLVIGVLVGHFAARLPLVAVAALTVAAYFLFGGAVVARERAAAGFLPGPDALGTLARSAVDSWKQLLTTVPPVDGTGPMLVIPFVLGLVCGSVGFTLAHRLRLSAAPAFAPLVVFVVVILLGTREPFLPLVQGAALTCLVLAWSAIRARRRRRPTRNGGRRVTRLASTAAGC